ncbi:hypothetical protein ACOSQ4_009735 [Xanthoceras sorbifolium]
MRKSIKIKDFKDRVIWLLSEVEVDVVLQFLIMAWMLGRDKNLILHGEKKFQDDNFWPNAGRFLMDLKEADCLRSSQVHCADHDEIRKRPACTSFKLNVDAVLVW